MKVSKPVVPMSLESLWVLFVEQAAHILDAEQERLSAEDYLMNSDDCIRVLREAVPSAPSVPGVTQLVEALEEAKLTIEVLQGRGNSAGVTLSIIDRALAPYRKGGEV